MKSIECARQFVAVSGALPMVEENDGGKVSEICEGMRSGEVRLETKV